MKLTPSEREVLGLYGQGLLAKDIATVRSCSEGTVREHLETVKRKTGANNLAQAWALTFGRQTDDGRVGDS